MELLWRVMQLKNSFKMFTSGTETLTECIFQNPKSKIQNPKSKIQNPKSKMVLDPQLFTKAEDLAFKILERKRCPQHSH